MKIYQYVFDRLLLDTIWMYYIGVKDIRHVSGSVHVSPRGRPARRPLLSNSGSLEMLLSCRQVHDEAEPVLYRSLTFLLRPYDYAPGYVDRFFGRLSKRARLNITNLRCVWDPDRYDDVSSETFKFWDELCTYTANRLPGVNQVGLAVGKRKPIDIPASAFTDLLKFQSLQTFELTVIYDSSGEGADVIHRLELRVQRLFEQICLQVLNSTPKPQVTRHDHDVLNNRLSLMVTNKTCHSSNGGLVGG